MVTAYNGTLAAEGTHSIWGGEDLCGARGVGVPRSKDFPDGLKYRFALIQEGKRVLGYDNERGKGHHRHTPEGKEESFHFTSPEALRKRFLVESRVYVKKKARRG